MSIPTEDIQDIQQELEKLTPEDRRKVVDFAKYLRDRRENMDSSIPSFDWAGRLEHLSKKYTAEELEEKANEWRTGEN